MKKIQNSTKSFSFIFFQLSPLPFRVFQRRWSLRILSQTNHYPRLQQPWFSDLVRLHRSIEFVTQWVAWKENISKWISILPFKVRLFWEGHKYLELSPTWFDIYLVNSIFLWSSQKNLNFTKYFLKCLDLELENRAIVITWCRVKDFRSIFLLLWILEHQIGSRLRVKIKYLIKLKF